MAKIGILPLGRPTFDVPFAEEMLAGMLANLDASGHEIIGPRGLLFDADATLTAIGTLKAASPDRVLFLQVTFTDASMAVEAANAFPDTPLAIWAVPEPRLGGRLRLNAFCGLNLASHALGLNHRSFGWLYGPPDSAELAALLDGGRMAGRLDPVKTEARSAAADAAIARLDGRRIGRIGEHPIGFDTCAYDGPDLKSLTGITVDALSLEQLFDTARAADGTAVARVRDQAATLDGIEDVNQDELDKSLRLKVALDTIRADGGYDAFAIRCWPETFTEYGGAVCGPVAMLGEARVPCACEADVYGAVSQMMLQNAAEAPVFLVDLVDMDLGDDTGVVWHCGQAPISMRDPDIPAEATIHTNRKMPLLYEFPLKPGRVTFLRLSQAHGQVRLVISGGEMLKRDMAFTGTSGVVRFDRDAGRTLQDVIDSGLEHHMALAYGDHRDTLRAMAGALNIPVLEI
ncbi:hypothetical protein FHS89_001254 [Rubricella aquisinus]|uniref:L-fucose isomerase C-terminal domain-containing protein n=1 Tax=Rubricella aquisinus TaxID=2028108 RepID=A0A840WXZ3_9RHOB|nr:hypothetical protein [Rubricella aquisinus]MBB5515244.1 hypothetical protein [Rubricella aquisinus]